MTDLGTRHRNLVDDLTNAGKLPAQWRQAWFDTPRHLFVPAQIHVGGALVDRAADPDGWADAVYTDRALTTQVDDGASDGPRVPTSSTSMPTIVGTMLAHLDVEPGMRVLEVGTGTGWNAALLAARLGDDAVVSIEVDPDVAARARKALADAGRAPTVITGDGTAGVSAQAPFDRVIVTAAVRDIPYAWVQQTRPDGLILLPWATAFDAGVLVALRVDGHGTASGHVVDANVAFMPLRAQRGPARPLPVSRAHADRSTTTLDPDTIVWDDLDARFAVGLRLPDVAPRFVDADDGTDDYMFWLITGDSWALVQVRDGADEHPVVQYGMRRLWDELVAAYEWWTGLGRPDATRFGLTVTPSGQAVWLDESGSVITPDGAPVYTGR